MTSGQRQEAKNGSATARPCVADSPRVEGAIPPRAALMRTPCMLPIRLFVQEFVSNAGPPQRNIVGDLQQAAGNERERVHPAANSARLSVGLSAPTRLRGTAVKLAAAVRSAGVTTAIT